MQTWKQTLHKILAGIVLALVFFDLAVLLAALLNKIVGG